MDELISRKFKSLITDIIKYQINPTLDEISINEYKVFVANDEIEYNIEGKIEQVIGLLDKIRYKIYSVTFQIAGSRTYEEFINIYSDADEDGREDIEKKLKKD